MRLIINGKSAGDPALRSAVKEIRKAEHPLDVRVTWEGGDAARYAAEATQEGIDVVIAGGGDGTVNEVAGACSRQGSMDKSILRSQSYRTAQQMILLPGVAFPLVIH